MHSTDREASSLVLSYRRAEMAAFWIVTTATFSLGASFAAWLLDARHSWTWTAAGLCALAPRLVWRRWFEWGIAAWNKGVRVIANSLRAYVLRVSYHLLFAAMGQSGSSMDVVLRDAAASRWISRSQSDVSFEPGWWKWCLVPIMWLLRLLPDDRQDSAPLRSTYTLY